MQTWHIFKQLYISWIFSVKIGWNWTVTGVVMVWGHLCVGLGCTFQCVCDSQKHQSLIRREFLWAATPLLYSTLWGWPVHEFNFVLRGLFVYSQWNVLWSGLCDSTVEKPFVSFKCDILQYSSCVVSFWRVLNVFPSGFFLWILTGYCAQVHPG